MLVWGVALDISFSAWFSTRGEFFLKKKHSLTWYGGSAIKKVKTKALADFLDPKATDFVWIPFLAQCRLSSDSTPVVDGFHNCSSFMEVLTFY